MAELPSSSDEQDAAAPRTDVERYLFLASAVAGRRLSVHVSAAGDALAFSDGQSIVVPVRDDDALTRREVVAQAALIAAGSLDPAILRQLLGRKQVALRYVYLEVLRAAQLLADRLPWSFTAQAELRVAPLSDTPAASLAIALSLRKLPDAPEWFGSVRPLMALRRAVSDEGFSALTKRQQEGRLEKRDVLELGEDDEGEESKILKLFQNPFAGNNPLSDLLRNLLGSGTSKSKREKSEGDGGAEMPIGRIERALRRGVNAVLAKAPVELPEIDVTAESQALAYPEWDEHKQVYKPNWVFVEEVEPWRPDGAQDISKLLVPNRELQRQLGSLGLDHEMHRRQNEGTDLDLGPLLDCAIELRTGHTPASLNIYRASRRTRRDLAVAIVLDISGSTGEQNGENETIFAKQMRVAYQLATTLNTLGDTVSVFGFHSWGRKLVRVVRLKGHEERWSGRVAERFSLLEAVGYTRTGTAIRHGTRLLTTQVRLPNRLMVLITDGIAYDHDYEQRYAEGDARKALIEAKAAGTACVCLSIGSSTQTEKLQEIFGAANILAVDEPEQIIGRIREVCRQAVAAVSQRKLQPAGRKTVVG